MNKYIEQTQVRKLRGKLLENEPLAKYTSWRVGGPAQRLYQPADIKDLSLFLSLVPEEEPVILLGAGTNVLVRDRGINGTVILLHNTLSELSASDSSDSKLILSESGVSSVKLAHYVAELGLTGLEFLAGIPGTVGGALAMNAGAYGNETWKHVVRVETINRQGKRFMRQPSDFQVGYRKVIGKSDEWFVAAHFQLQRGSKEVILQSIHDMLAKRKRSQPLDLPSAGSVFKNPENNYAVQLIEGCGLKGCRIGGACVSEKHANFIVNDAGATAADIEELIKYVAEKVEKEAKVRLESEVKILGLRG
jgi:UDP-N-acetylmuramate dehydrogenase